MNYMVCVRCITFNHSAYIVDALDGFCIQQTNFPYVCTVVDDASTDNEQQIIKQYVNEHFDMPDGNVLREEDTDDYKFIFAQHLKNKNCFFAVYFLKYNHYSIRKSKDLYLEKWSNIKYSAVCEGDDYWTHPNKLQRQVDFLESHPNYSLCFHAHFSLRPDGTKIECYRYKEDIDECPMSDMILAGGGFMATASMLYVTKLKVDWPEWAQKAPIGDAPLMLVLAERGKVAYINEVMSCYRIAVPGSWSMRMAQSAKMRREVLLKIIQYKKGFDEWTNYKYHKYVRKTIFNSYLSYYIKSLPFAEKIVKYLKSKR